MAISMSLQECRQLSAEYSEKNLQLDRETTSLTHRKISTPQVQRDAVNTGVNRLYRIFE